MDMWREQKRIYVKENLREDERTRMEKYVCERGVLN